MTSRSSSHTRRANVPQCPLRYGEPCTLCQAFVTGPEDCQTVAIVMDDPDLKAQWVKGRTKWARAQRLAKQAAREAAKCEAANRQAARYETEQPLSTTGLFTGTPKSW